MSIRNNVRDFELSTNKTGVAGFGKRNEGSSALRKNARTKELDKRRHPPPSLFAFAAPRVLQFNKGDYVEWVDDNNNTQQGYVREIDNTNYVVPMYGIYSEPTENYGDFKNLSLVEEDLLTKVNLETADGRYAEEKDDNTYSNIKQQWDPETGKITPAKNRKGVDSNKLGKSLDYMKNNLIPSVASAYASASNPSSRRPVEYKENAGIEEASILDLIYSTWGVREEFQNEPLFLTGLEESNKHDYVNWKTKRQSMALSATEKNNIIRPTLIQSVQTYEAATGITDARHVPLCMVVSVGDKKTGFEWHTALLILYYDYEAQQCKVISVGEGYSEAARHARFDTHIDLAAGYYSAHTGKIAIFSPDRWTKYTPGQTKNPNYIVTGIFVLTSGILSRIHEFMQSMNNAYFYNDNDGIYDRTEFTTNKEDCLYLETGSRLASITGATGSAYSCASWVKRVMRGYIECNNLSSRPLHYIANPIVGIKAVASAALNIDNPSLCVDVAFGSIMPDDWFRQLLDSMRQGNVPLFVDIIDNKQKYMGIIDKIRVAFHNGSNYVSSWFYKDTKAADFGDTTFGGGRRKTKRNKKSKNRKSKRSRK